MGINQLKKVLQSNNLYRNINLTNLWFKRLVFDGNSICERLRSVQNEADAIKSVLRYVDFFKRSRQTWVFDGCKYKPIDTRPGSFFFKIKDILAGKGVEVHEADGEGEQYCARLKSDYIITSDTDIFVFGGTNVIFDLVCGRTRLDKMTSVEVFSMDSILKHFSITFDQFVFACILGSGMKGVGIKGALTHANDSSWKKKAIAEFLKTDDYTKLIKFYKHH